MKRTYETCGKPFSTRKAAERYARNIANASGIRLPVYETTGCERGSAERSRRDTESGRIAVSTSRPKS